VAQRTASGQWGSTSGQGVAVAPAELVKLRSGLESLQAEYCNALEQLTSSIPTNVSWLQPAAMHTCRCVVISAVPLLLVATMALIVGLCAVCSDAEVPGRGAADPLQ
jgi:hypothetical protein